MKLDGGRPYFFEVDGTTQWGSYDEDRDGFWLPERAGQGIPADEAQNVRPAIVTDPEPRHVDEVTGL